MTTTVEMSKNSWVSRDETFFFMSFHCLRMHSMKSDFTWGKKKGLSFLCIHSFSILSSSKVWRRKTSKNKKRCLLLERNIHRQIEIERNCDIERYRKERERERSQRSLGGIEFMKLFWCEFHVLIFSLFVFIMLFSHAYYTIFSYTISHSPPLELFLIFSKKTFKLASSFPPVILFFQQPLFLSLLRTNKRKVLFPSSLCHHSPFSTFSAISMKEWLITHKYIYSNSWIDAHQTFLFLTVFFFSSFIFIPSYIPFAITSLPITFRLFLFWRVGGWSAPRYGY